MNRAKKFFVLANITFLCPILVGPGIQAALLGSALILMFLILYGNSENSSKYKLPPGPRGLPVVGCLPWLMKDRTRFMMEMAKKFGPFFSFRLGNTVNVIINDYESIKEFGNIPEVQSRPDTGFVRDLIKGRGIINAEGEKWKHQRRFVLHSLRDSGMGKLQMEAKILHEIKTVVKLIKKNGGETMSFKEILCKATWCITSNLAFNVTYHYDDPHFIDMIHRLMEHVKMIGELMVLSLFPLFTPFYKYKIVKTNQNMAVFLENCKNIIKEHKKNLDMNNLQDLVDLYLVEMRKEQNEENEAYLSTFDEEQLAFVIQNLFLAGTETSSTTIQWTLIFMSRHPEIQEKVQAELDEVIGSERFPAMSDKLQLPYTSATLQEVERYASIAPRALPRSNKTDFTFKGYTFPPNTVFFFNVHAVHFDPRLWKDPESFNPDRFIQQDGQCSRPPYLIPFGSGRRACVGEALARMEIFLIFSSLMQRFSFRIPKDVPLEIKPAVGVINVPSDFKLQAIPRNVA